AAAFLSRWFTARTPLTNHGAPRVGFATQRAATTPRLADVFAVPVSVVCMKSGAGNACQTSNVPSGARRLAEMRGARAQIAANRGKRCNPGATEMLTLLAEHHTREPISSDPSPSSRSVAVHRRRVPSWRPAPPG